MITKDDIIKKCRAYHALEPLVKIIEPRDFTEVELEAIDFVIETHYALKVALEVIKETMVAKLEIWLSSTKDTDSPT